MISIVVNFDSRPHWDGEESFVGQDGEGSLHGVRHKDFWTHGITSIERFFAGSEFEIIAVMDEVTPIPDYEKIAPNHRVIITNFDKTKYRWNDHLYLDSLAHAEGEYICHIDGDVSLFRSPNSNVVQQYLEWLESGKYKFICQPSSLSYEEHQMDHASTRFFICKRENLSISELRGLLDDRNRAKRFGMVHLPCLEHIIGAVAGKGTVHYPPLNMSDHIIFSWAKYKSGLLQKLNSLPYEWVVGYINECGLFGANDLIAK